MDDPNQKTKKEHTTEKSGINDGTIKEEEKKPEQIAYVERAFYSFVKKTFFGGLKLLQSKPYRVYFWYTIILIGTTICFGILNNLGFGISEDIMKRSLYFEILCALGLIIGGILGGLFKNEKIIGIFTFIINIGAGLFTWWMPLPYDHVMFQTFRFIFFITYTAISLISMFFIILYFHTSLSYKIVNLGNSPDRMLFQPFIRLGGFITLGMFIYLLLQNNIDTYIIGTIGIIVGIILLKKYYTLPKADKNENFDIKEDHKARLTFIQVMGYYNFYLIYQISQCFNTGGNFSNIIVELALVALNTLFMINSLSRKVENITDLDEIENKKFVFQQNTSIFMKVKKRLGEKSLIIISLSIALGYHTVIMDSFLDTNLLFFQNMTAPNTPMNVIFHRISVIFMLIFLVIIMIVFAKSANFRSIVINRYSFRHTMRMLGDVFKKGATDIIAPMEQAFTQSKQKVTEFGENLKKEWSKIFPKVSKPNTEKDTNVSEEQETKEKRK